MTQTSKPMLLQLDDVDVGMALAQSVLGPQGEVVLSQGVELTQALLQALRRRGVASLSVFVADAEPLGESLATTHSRARLARLDRLFRNSDGQSGTAHLRTLVTQYRTEIQP